VNIFRQFFLFVLACLIAGCQTEQKNIAESVVAVPPVISAFVQTNVLTTDPTNAPVMAPAAPASPTNMLAWLGVQLFILTDTEANALATAMPKIAALGVNSIIVEVGYSFDFKSHPELRRGKGISRVVAKNLAAVARTNGVRLIPELDCLGHQSLRKSTLPLLAKHPEFTEPSPSNPDLKTDYLKNWCPNDERINPIVFDLIDEIVEAFDADAFHIGMDEIFNLASDNCPRCKGSNPTKLFAKVVNEFHTHIVGEKKLEMFMWGDRLLDASRMGYSKWEASRIGTAGAIDLIPTNIVICDWHYGKQTNYPSVPYFLAKGFRVWPAGFRPVEKCKALSDFTKAQRAQNPRVVGYLATTWSAGKPETVAKFPPLVEILKDWRTTNAPATQPQAK
jgi:hypothetical protein